MFRKKPTWIDEEIDRVVAVLNSYPVLSDEWVVCSDRLSKLEEMKYSAPSVSRDTLVGAAANLLGILMIVKHEYVNVINSKAVSLLVKPRI